VKGSGWRYRANRRGQTRGGDIGASNGRDRRAPAQPGRWAEDHAPKPLAGKKAAERLGDGGDGSR